MPSTSPDAATERRAPHNPLAGIGLWVWNAGDHDPTALAARCQREGVNYLALKVHDGTSTYNAVKQVEAYKRACGIHHLDFVVWGYCTAHDAAGEARLAAELVKKYGASAYIADVEIEYEQAQGPVSKTFAETFRKHEPHLPAAVAPFGRLDYHAGINYHAWHGHGFDVIPQAYENESDANRPDLCVKSCEQVGWGPHQIHPAVGAYPAEGRADHRRLSSKHLADSLRGLPIAGASIWEAATAPDSDLRDIAKLHQHPKPRHRPAPHRGPAPHHPPAHAPKRHPGGKPAPHHAPPHTHRDPAAASPAEAITPASAETPAAAAPSGPGVLARIVALLKLVLRAPLAISKAQILHLLVVLVIVPVAGFIATLAAKLVPGLHLDTGTLIATFSTGAGAALTVGLHYLHGLQLWERYAAPFVTVTQDTGIAKRSVTTLDPGAAGQIEDTGKNA